MFIIIVAVVVVYHEFRVAIVGTRIDGCTMIVLLCVVESQLVLILLSILIAFDQVESIWYIGSEEGERGKIEKQW